MWLEEIKRGGGREMQSVFQVSWIGALFKSAFSPNSRTSPLRASVEAAVPREQVLRAQGAHARTHTHAHLQLPLGFCVTCDCLTRPTDPFWGRSVARGAPFPLHSPAQGLLTPLSFLSSLLVFYCHPVSFPFLSFPFVSSRFLHISNRPFSRPALFGPALALSFSPCVFLSLPHSCLDVRPFQTECFLSVCCQAKGHCPLGLWKEQIDRNNVLT